MVGYSKKRLNEIYQKSSGYCAICGKKLSLINYGKPKRKAPWEVDHSNPLSKGGTKYFRNLRAVCISCNRKKGTKRRVTKARIRWLLNENLSNI
jgi:5-methylcytosine-specific restriction endonuclease McrA